MASALLYSSKKEASEVKVPADFSKEAPLETVAQAFHVYRERSHTGLPQVQTRAQVSLTTKKMYKQKHTGNARHSSAKAPLFVGGGVTHGPKGVKTTHTLTKAMRKASRSGAVSLKLAQKEVAFLDVSAVTKTKEASALVKKSGARNAAVALTAQNWGKAKAFRNIAQVSVFPWETINAYPVLNHHMLLVDSLAVEAPKAEKKTATKPETKKVTKKS